MFNFFKKPEPKPKFDKKILRKNDISILILDERWNNLFVMTEKTPEIIQCEEKLRELLKQQSRLTAESKEILPRKKHYLDRIMGLTPEAFDRNNPQAREEMLQCEKEVKKLNDRALAIEEEIDQTYELLKEINLELLEHTVNVVYFKIRADQKRAEELEVLIQETKETLKAYIEEKQTLCEGNTDIYCYFHDLLGGEELEKLDQEFFGDTIANGNAQKKV